MSLFVLQVSEKPIWFHPDSWVIQKYSDVNYNIDDFIEKLALKYAKTQSEIKVIIDSFLSEKNKFQGTTFTVDDLQW